MATILIADDETNLRKVLSAMLRKDGHTPIAVPTGEDALRSMAEDPVDVVISDLKMPGMTGLELLEEVHARNPSLPFILITAHGTVDTAVSALKSGAFDYVTKPFDRSELRDAVRKAVATREAGRERFHDTGDAQGRFKIIGESRRMRAIFDVIEKVADTPSTVLITGESGTGKELVATALHEQSSRRDQPFIRVNCAAIPRDLLESEFFGYEQGAFTGAVGSKPGRFELADRGTLLLDEIAEIPIEMQVKLLRALQESEFERVGGVRTMKVDVRVIAATNRDLAGEIAAGNFREDLYYRLNVVPVTLPALRERAEDIPLLCQFFVDKYAQRLKRDIQGLSPEAERVLQSHTWPGNIRELENVIERSMLFAENPVIGVADLPEAIRGGADASSSVLASSSTATPDQATSEFSDVSLKDIVRKRTSELERHLIQGALEQTGGNVTRAAERLQISRKGLQNKMKELGLREE
ncbi:MAG: sigma-54 dependent transcriptional regulator [Myxococcota bacterium]